MAKKRTTWKVVIAWLAVLIVSLMTFALWDVVNQAVHDMIINLTGTENLYLQGIIIIVGGLVIIFLLSRLNKRVRFMKALKDVLRL